MKFSKFVFKYTIPSRNYVILFHSISLKKVYLPIPTFENLDKNPELISKLKELGFFDDSYDYKLIENLKKEVKKKINVSYVMLTDACNMNCEYCYMIKKDRTPIFMNKETADKVISKIKELSSKVNLYRIYFYGGEPFLNKKIMFYIAEKLSNSNIKFFVNTNGTLITDDDIKLLKKFDFHVSISLDGNVYLNSKRGETYKVISTIARLKDAGVGVGISCTITDENYLHLKEIVKFFHDIGINNFGFNLPLFSKKGDVYEIDPSLLADSLFEAFKETQKYGMRESRAGVRRWYHLVTEKFRLRDCAAQGAQVFFTPDGKIGPCHGFHDDEPFLTDTLNSKLFDEFIDVPIFHEECLSCPAIGVCGGACQYNSYIKYGKRSIIDKDYCIFMRRLLYNMLVYYLDRYVLKIKFDKPTFTQLDDLKKFVSKLDLDTVSQIKNLDSWLSNIINSTLNELTSSLIATEDGKIVGFAAAVPMKNRSFEIFVAVDKDHRRKGIGTTLIQLLINDLRSIKLKYNSNLNVIIKINKKNIASQKLFEKFVRKIGETDDQYIYTFNDDVF